MCSSHRYRAGHKSGRKLASVHVVVASRYNNHHTCVYGAINCVYVEGVAALMPETHARDCRLIPACSNPIECAYHPGSRSTTAVGENLDTVNRCPLRNTRLRASDGSSTVRAMSVCITCAGSACRVANHEAVTRQVNSGFCAASKVVMINMDPRVQDVNVNSSTPA